MTDTAPLPQDTIDEIYVDVDEDGFHLKLVGDFDRSAALYLAADAATYRFRLPHDAALQLLAQARTVVGPWAAEAEGELAAYRRATRDERDAVLAGRRVDDPGERLREHADVAYKAARENA